MDGTANQKDTSQVTGDSSKGGQGTSVKTPETYTREQVDAEKTKAISDALSKAGRDAKALEKRAEAIKASEARIAELERQKDESELEAAEDDGARRAILARQKARQREAEFATEKAAFAQEKEQWKETLTRVQELERTRKAAEIAVQYGVSIDPLLENTDGSEEAMERLAKVLPKTKPSEPPIKLDSGTTIGGGELTEEQKLKKRYPTMN